MAASQVLGQVSRAPSSFEKESVVRGHHIYKIVWSPVIGEELPLSPEDSNEHDDHAVAVLKGGDVIGHIPRSISRIAWFFLQRGGSITCRITGKRKVGVGLEVPCVYRFSGSIKNVAKLRRLFCEGTQPLVQTQSCPLWLTERTQSLYFNIESLSINVQRINENSNVHE